MKRFSPMNIIMGYLLLSYSVTTFAALPFKKASDLAAQCAEQAQAIELEAWLNQANDLFRQEAYDQAAAIYRAIITSRPHVAIAHYNLGLVYLATQEPDKAISALTRATQHDPHYELAHYFLGYAYQTVNQFDAAVTCYDQCISINPYRYEAHLNKGRALANLGHLDQAMSSYELALDNYGYDAQTHKEFGLLCAKKGDNAKALTHYRRAAVLAPHNSTELHYTLAHHLYTTGDFNAAIPEYNTVLKNEPNHARAHHEVGACYIAGGNIQEGLTHRCWRQQTTRSGNVTPLSIDYDNLCNKTVYIHAEAETLPDLIQHARYIPLLKQRGAQVTLIVEKERAPLFQHNPFIDTVVDLSADTAKQAADYELPIAGIAHALKEYAINENAVPYLYTDPELDAYWKEQLAGDSGFRVGICFQGQENAQSLFLDHCAPLLQIPGVSCYLLHPLHHQAQNGLIPSNLSLKNIAHLYNDRYAHIAHQASILKQMDLIITIDETLGHLAGALGVKTWVFAPHIPDWHWSTRSGHTPWYPTVTIYKQGESGLKSTVTEAIANLEAFLYEKEKLPQCGTALEGTTQLIAEVSVGELVDKMTILEIKSERMKDPTKLHNVVNEYRALSEAFENQVPHTKRTKKLNSLKRKLKEINEKLWDIEDNIRDKESKQEFDTQFIALARSVYFTNDRRGELKRKINELVGSRLVEEKTYTRYQK